MGFFGSADADLLPTEIRRPRARATVKNLSCHGRGFFMPVPSGHNIGCYQLKSLCYRSFDCHSQNHAVYLHETILSPLNEKHYGQKETDSRERPADRRQSEHSDRRRPGTRDAARSVVPRKTRSFRPRGHSRTAHARQGFRCIRHLYGHAGHHPIHARLDLRPGRQKDRMLRALLDRGRRTRRSRRRTRHPRLRHEILHRCGQLGPRGQQHPGILPARPAEIPRPEPCRETRPAHQSALGQQQLGFLDPAARSAASGDDHHVAAGHSGLVPPHARIRKPHVQFLRQGQPAHLGEVPPQDPAGHQKPDRRRGRSPRRQRPRIAPARLVRRHRTRRFPALDDVRATDDRRGGPQLQAQSVRPDKSMVSQGFPAARSRRPGVEPQSGELLCGCRAVGVQPHEHRRGHRFLARQDVAGPSVLLRRRAALPTGREPHGDSREQAPLSVPRVPPRRADAHRRQLRFGQKLRTQQLRRMAGQSRPQRAALGRERRRIQLRRTRAGRRLFHPTRTAVAHNVARGPAGDLREHGARHERCGTVHQTAPCAPLLLRRPGLRQGRGRSARNLARRGAQSRRPRTSRVGPPPA